MINVNAKVEVSLSEGYTNTHNTTAIIKKIENISF